MELRSKESQGCCFEIIDGKTKEVILKKHNNGSCFSDANRRPKGSILNIYEPKANIDFSVEEIQEYLGYIKETGCFLGIEFISDYNELEYKFVVIKDKDECSALFKGTYSVIRYLWGDGAGHYGNNFQIVVKNYLQLVKEHPKLDKYALLQVAHIGLKSSYNSNHALLYKDFKVFKAKDFKIKGDSMNDSYSMCSEEDDDIEKVYNGKDKVKMLKRLYKELENELILT